MQRLSVDAPAHAAVVVAFVVECEASLLQRRQITPNRPRGDLEIRRQTVDRRAMPGRLQRMKQAPLTDDFLITRHAG